VTWSSPKFLFQVSSKKLFNLQKFWLLLESGRFKEGASVPQKSGNSHAVVYSADSNGRGQLNYNFTYKLSDLGNCVLSKLRILADSEVTWVQRNRRIGPTQETQVSHRNA
jgi:hypothetical protein